MCLITCRESETFPVAASVDMPVCFIMLPMKERPSPTTLVPCLQLCSPATSHEPGYSRATNHGQGAKAGASMDGRSS